MIVTAKQGADVQYLVSGIVQEALKQKFKTLFGRDPVARTETDPMKVVDARIPDIIAETLNSDIAKVLKTTAVESTELTSGDLPTLNSATFLYSILEDTPTRISIEAIPEYKELQNDAEPVISAVNDTTSISIQNGTAYIPEEMSAITIGIFCDNKQFAAEFQYRLSNAGGNEIESDKKKEVFDKLYSELPGGDQKTDATVKQELLKVVGLNEFAPPSEPPKETKAPGPEAIAPSPETASIQSNEFSLDRYIKENGFGLKNYRKNLREIFDISNDDMDNSEREYINYASSHAPLKHSTIVQHNRTVECGDIVTSSKYPKKVFSIASIFESEVMLEDSSNGKHFIDEPQNLSIY